MHSVFYPQLMISLVSRQPEASQRLWAEQVLGIDTTAMPRRCFLERPEDNGAYVLPIKQSFVKDARLMPGTRIMLALLTGWAGKGGPLQLTERTIAKHLQRSVRQVFRYLQDAAREGYLRYAYTKNRIGMITGLKIYLSFPLLRPRPSSKPQGKLINSARTLASDTNEKQKYTPYQDPQIAASLERFRQAAGLKPL